MKKFSKGEQSSMQGKHFRVRQRRLVVEEVIAHGGFSIVMRVIQPATSEIFALKRMLVNEQEALDRCVMEININTQLNGHPNIATLIDTRVTSMPGGNVHEVLMLYKLYHDTVLKQMTYKQKFSQSEVLDLFSHVCRAIAALHQSNPPIVHRDLKVENLLVDTDGNTTVLCDFGSASLTPLQPSLHGVGVVEEEIQKYTTLSYRSPEMIDLYEDHAIDTRSDIWALGCLLYRLCFFTNPFGDSALAISSANYTIPPLHPYDYRIIKIIKSTLSATPSQRPDIYQLSHLISIINNTPCPVNNHNSVPILTFEDLEGQERKALKAKPLRPTQPDQPIGTSIKPRERPRSDNLANKNPPTNLIIIQTPHTLKPANHIANSGGVVGSSRSSSNTNVTKATHSTKTITTTTNNTINTCSTTYNTPTTNTSVEDIVAVSSISRNPRTTTSHPHLTTINPLSTTPSNNLINLYNPFSPSNNNIALLSTPSNHNQASPGLAGLDSSVLNFNQSKLINNNNNNNSNNANTNNNNINNNSNNNNHKHNNNHNNNLNNNHNNNMILNQHMNNSMVNIHSVPFPPHQKHRRNFSDTTMLPTSNRQQLQQQLKQQQLLLQQQQQQLQSSQQIKQNNQPLNQQNQHIQQNQPQHQQQSLQQKLLREQHKLWRLQQQQQQQHKAFTPVVMMPTLPFQQQQQQPFQQQPQTFQTKQQPLFQQQQQPPIPFQQTAVHPQASQQLEITQLPFQQLSLQQKQQQPFQRLPLQQHSAFSNNNNFYTPQTITHSQSNLFLFNPTFQKQKQQHQQQQQHSNIDAFGDVPFNKMVSHLKQSATMGHKRSTSDLL